MSDHIFKKNQVNFGHTGTTGIRLKPVTDATKLILENAKAAVADIDGNDKVLDSDREMDLTFYDANGNIETADLDGDVSMEDDTTMQSIEHDDDVSSSIDEPVSADTSFTTASDDAARFDSDSIMLSIEQIDGASSSIEPFSSDIDETSAEAAAAFSSPKLLDRGARGHSVALLTNVTERRAFVESRATYSEDDGDDYGYDKYAFRQKPAQRCDNSATDEDSSKL